MACSEGRGRVFESRRARQFTGVSATPSPDGALCWGVLQQNKGARRPRLSGNSAVGRVSPCQGEGRDFKSRFPLQYLPPSSAQHLRLGGGPGSRHARTMRSTSIATSVPTIRPPVGRSRSIVHLVRARAAARSSPRPSLFSGVGTRPRRRLVVRQPRYQLYS